MPILSDRRQARFVEGTFPFLFSVVVPAALGLLALILTAAAVQIVGAQLFRDTSEIAGFAPWY